MFDLLNPKKMAKKWLKSKIPQLKKDFEAIIESMLMQVAEAHQKNPYELVLIISVMEGKATARVFEADGKTLIDKMDIGAMVEAIFQQQLQVVPEQLQDLAKEQIGEQKIEDVVISNLKDRSIIIHYNEDDNFVFVQVTKTGTENIDLDIFFNSLEF